MLSQRPWTAPWRNTVRRCGAAWSYRPIRAAPYISMVRLAPWYVDGVEVCNADFENRLAAQYTQNHGLPGLNGSADHFGPCRILLSAERRADSPLNCLKWSAAGLMRSAGCPRHEEVCRRVGARPAALRGAMGCTSRLPCTRHLCAGLWAACSFYRVAFSIPLVSCTSLLA